MLGPNSPATLIALAGSILLILTSLSSPILKSLYFLSVQIDSAQPSLVPLSGRLELGVFGYCLQIGAQTACSPPHLGYDLSFDSVSLSLPPTIDLGSAGWVIRALTYALILHPIAAGFGLLSLLAGLLAHLRRYSRSCFISLFTSLATITALLAFALDIIAFSIARKRIDASSNAYVTLNSRLGNALWMTLAGSICLALSGFGFYWARRLIYRRQREQAQADFLRPMADPDYSNQMRVDATEAEKARGKDPSILKPSNSGLPAFVEHDNDPHHHQEHIPLNRYPSPDQDQFLADPTTFHHLDHHPAPPQALNPIDPPDPYGSFTGVGVGLGRHSNQPKPLTHTASMMSHKTTYSQASHPSQPSHPYFIPPLPVTMSSPLQHPTPIPSDPNTLEDHTPSSGSVGGTPSRSSSYLSTRRHPPSLTPAGGGTYVSAPSSQVPPMPSVAIYDPRQTHYLTSPPPPRSQIVHSMSPALPGNSVPNHAHNPPASSDQASSVPAPIIPPGFMTHEPHQDRNLNPLQPMSPVLQPLAYPSYHRRTNGPANSPIAPMTPDRRPSDPPIGDSFRRPTQSELDSMYGGHYPSYSLESNLDPSITPPAAIPTNALGPSRHADPHIQFNDQVQSALVAEPDQIYGLPPSLSNDYHRPRHSYYSSVANPSIVPANRSTLGYAPQQQIYSDYMATPQHEIDEQDLYRSEENPNVSRSITSPSYSLTEVTDPSPSKRQLPSPPGLPPLSLSPPPSSHQNESPLIRRADSRIKGPRQPRPSQR